LQPYLITRRGGLFAGRCTPGYARELRCPYIQRRSGLRCLGTAGAAPTAPAPRGRRCPARRSPRAYGGKAVTIHPASTPGSNGSHQLHRRQTPSRGVTLMSEKVGDERMFPTRAADHDCTSERPGGRDPAGARPRPLRPAGTLAGGPRPPATALTLSHDRLPPAGRTWAISTATPSASSTGSQSLLGRATRRRRLV
jgi:hypothetical protein